MPSPDRPDSRPAPLGADDRRRRPARGRVGGRRLVRGQRPSGRVGRDARRILGAARELGWRPSASARAPRGAHAGDRAGARPQRRAARAGCVLRALPGRDRAGADRGRLRAAAAARAGRGRRGSAAGLRAARGGGARGRVPADGRRARRTGVRAAGGGRRAGRAGGARPAGECPFEWVETRQNEEITPRRSSTWWRWGTRGSPSSAGAGTSSTCRCGSRAGARRSRDAVKAWRKGSSCTRTTARSRPPRTCCCPRSRRAIVCASDVLSGAVVVAARARGLDVPGDVSVTGFDDSPLAALASPALTSVRVDYAEFGEAATRALLAEIGGATGAGVRAVAARAGGPRVDGAGAVACRGHDDRDPHRLGHVRATGIRRRRGRNRSPRTGARRSSRAGRGRASTCCTSRATAPGTRGSPTTSRTGRTSRR